MHSALLSSGLRCSMSLSNFPVFLVITGTIVYFFSISILERRIADVQKSRNLIAAETKVDFSDAAGFRRPVKFNCISCSRPVELPLRGPLQTNMPVPRGVRTKRSKGPYLSFEMDQVRSANCNNAKLGT